jgi:hypothetical protein
MESFPEAKASPKMRAFEAFRRMFPPTVIFSVGAVFEIPRYPFELNRILSVFFVLKEMRWSVAVVAAPLTSIALTLALTGPLLRMRLSFVLSDPVSEA